VRTLRRIGSLGAAMMASLLFACDGGGDGDDEPPLPTDACADATSGTACTFAGIRGDEGFNGDARPRYQTRLNQVQDVVALADGTIWFSDFNNYLVRRIKTDGTVETMVGWTDPIFPGDGPMGGIPMGGGPGLDWQLNHPTNLLVDPEGFVVLVGWHNHKILRIDPSSGFVTVVVGGGAGFAGDGGPANKALLRQPNDATMDEAGNMYIQDQANQRVRMIAADGTISTIAGTGMPGYMDGPGLMAQFKWEGGSNPNPSGGIVHHQGKLYIADTLNNRIRVLDLADMMVSTFAGTGEEGFSGDGGPAASAQLNAPRDLEIGPEGDLYFADTDNGAVRAIELASGTIRTVVGTGQIGMSEEERLPATQTLLRRPFGVAFDTEGNLFVTDTLNGRIVKVMK
jgi:hypothetical protein